MRAMVTATKRPPRLGILPNIAEVIEASIALRPSRSAWREHLRQRRKLIAAQFRDESLPWDFADALGELKEMARRTVATVSEALEPPPPLLAPLRSEIPCASCGKTIVKTRVKRRFCSDRCRFTFHGLLKPPSEGEARR